MTILGQMLEESGIEKGIEKGITLTKKAFKLSKQGLTAEEIAKELQISIEEVNHLIN